MVIGSTLLGMEGVKRILRVLMIWLRKFSICSAFDPALIWPWSSLILMRDLIRVRDHVERDRADAGRADVQISIIEDLSENTASCGDILDAL